MSGRDDQTAEELSLEAELEQDGPDTGLPAGELGEEELEQGGPDAGLPAGETAAGQPGAAAAPGADGGGQPGVEPPGLAEVAAERDEYLDALRRLQAEFENYRKRTIRQQTELLEHATEGLVERLLPVLDALDLAREHARGTAGEDAAALERIAALLGDVLTKDGLARIGTVGEGFDPTVHEAVLHVPADEGDDAAEQHPVVDEVLRAGYRMRSRVLRPAMVKVRG